jgi:L-lactate permease
VSLSNILGLVLFMEVWPSLYLLGLFAGTGFAIAGLATYGSWQKRHPLFLKRQSDAAATDERSSAVNDLAAAAPPRYLRSVLIRAYGPLAVAVVYILLEMVPAYRSVLQHLQFSFAAWGYSPITVQFFTSPAFIILLAAFSSYVFAGTRGGSPIKDIAVGTAHSASSLTTMILSSSIMYLMADTGQLSFLGNKLAECGRIGYQLLDAAVIVLGGTIFGAGTPAVFAFAQMQMPAAASLGLPAVLLLGMVTLGALGCTNGLKPPTVRFVASLVNLDASGDNDIFRKGLLWACLQAVVLTLTLLVVTPFWTR